MKKLALLLIIATILVPFSAMAGPPSLKEYSQTLLSLKKNELVRLQNGETGVEGYALFGTTSPAYLLTGDIWADQLVSTSSRIKVLNKEIAFLQFVLSQLDQPPGGGTGGGHWIHPVADSHVYAYSYRNWNRANWGKYTNLAASWHPQGGEKRTYIKFDLPRIPKVKKAVLRLYVSHISGRPGQKLSAFLISSPWREGSGTYHSGRVEKSAAPGELSWNQQPRVVWRSGIVFSAGSKANTWASVDITRFVNAWLAGQPNYGVAIMPYGPKDGESGYSFYSREYKDPQKQPQLFLATSDDPIVHIDDPPGSGPARGTASLLTGNSNQDMVGPNETYRGNGRNDAIFRARFSAPNRTVTAVEVSNTNGLRSVWDTRPNNRLWLGVAIIGGRAMNRPDGSVNFRLGSGQTTLDFFVEDNGSIRGRRTNYRMTIFFANGNPLVMNITQGGGGGGGGTTGGGHVGANLLTNGSFEQGKPAGSSYVIINPGSIDLPGWQITGKNIDVVGSAWKSSHNLRAVDIHGTGPGGIRQSFATTPGKIYSVSFDLAGNPWAGPQIKTVHVDIPGIVQKTYRFDIKGKSPRNMGWTRHSFTFRATQARSTLHIFSNHPPGNGAGPAVDNVVVMAASKK